MGAESRLILRHSFDGDNKNKSNKIDQLINKKEQRKEDKSKKDESK